MVDTLDYSRTRCVRGRFASLEARFASSVKRCTDDLDRLLGHLDIESLRFLCKSTRLAWPSLLRLRVCYMQAPSCLVKELLGVMDLGIAAGQEVARDAQQRLDADWRQRANDYVAAITLRRQLVAMLTVSGIEVVYEDLYDRLIDVSPRVTNPIWLEFAKELRTGAERAGLGLTPMNNTSAVGPVAVTVVSPLAKYRIVLLARAFRGLGVQLFAHCAELLHEAGPFVDAVPDHGAILEAMLERLDWFASELDLPAPPCDEQDVQQELATNRSALQSYRSELQNVRQSLGELQKRLAAVQGGEEAAKVAIQNAARMVWDMQRRAETTWRQIAQSLPDELRDQMRKSMIEMQQAMRPALTDAGADTRAGVTVRDVLTPLGSLADAQVRDHEFFRQNREGLLRAYSGQFVAIRDGEILGSAPDLPGIHGFVEKRLGPDARAFISEVASEAFEDESDTLIYMG